MTSPPPRPPEGLLLEELRRAAGMSARGAAKAAGCSDTWWREVAQGYRKVGEGQYAIQRASASALARMASVVGATSGQLRAAARGDAADYLETMSDEANTGRQPRPDLDTTGLTTEQVAAVQAVIDSMRPAEK